MGPAWRRPGGGFPCTSREVVGAPCQNQAMTRDQERAVVPAQYSRVDPWVISSDTEAEISFLRRVFGGHERPGSRMLDAEGRIGHVEVEVDGAVIMLFDAHPDWPSIPAHLRIYVADVQAAFDSALA